jgi:hypothetical protein
MEHKYRRGYLHGVLTIMAALRRQVLKEEFSNLKAWAQGTLQKWSTSALELARRPAELPPAGNAARPPKN